MSERPMHHHGHYEDCRACAAEEETFCCEGTSKACSVNGPCGHWSGREGPDPVRPNKLQTDAHELLEGVCSAYQLAGKAILDPDSTDEDEISLLDFLADLAEKFDHLWLGD